MYIPPVELLLTVDSMLKCQVSIQTSPSASADPLQRMIHNVFPGTQLSIQRVEYSPGHLHRIRFVQLSNGVRLALKSSPLISNNLLRHERQCLENEARLLSVLASSGLPIPKLLAHETGNKTLGSPFLLTCQLPGICIEKIWYQLTNHERSSIDRQIQALGFSIGQHTSRSFGPLLLVSQGKGFGTWREAFMYMVESILSDGEDILVSLPYEEIRDQVSKAGPKLDKVKEARLVALGFDHPKNVLIDPVTKDVTGILDFGSALWGDFKLVERGAEDYRGHFHGYACFGAIVTVVTSHYRPKRDTEELDARKVLTASLAQLAKFNA